MQWTLKETHSALPFTGCIISALMGRESLPAANALPSIAVSCKAALSQILPHGDSAAHDLFAPDAGRKRRMSIMAPAPG